MIHRVRHRDTEAGVEFALRGQSSDIGGSLKNEHTLTGPGQVGSAYKAIVTGADDD
jgi:hypothetical protein